MLTLYFGLAGEVIELSSKKQCSHFILPHLTMLARLGSLAAAGQRNQDYIEDALNTVLIPYYPSKFQQQLSYIKRTRLSVGFEIVFFCLSVKLIE
jgi:hypothetical protein